MSMGERSMAMMWFVESVAYLMRKEWPMPDAAPEMSIEGIVSRICESVQCTSMWCLVNSGVES